MIKEIVGIRTTYLVKVILLVMNEERDGYKRFRCRLLNTSKYSRVNKLKLRIIKLYKLMSVVQAKFPYVNAP